MSTQYRLFVPVAPGLEPLLADELCGAAIGQAHAVVTGGVELVGAPRDLWRICVESRLADGARVRLGQPFAARTFDELVVKLARLPWHAFIPAAAPPPLVRVVCHHSRLYHSGAVAERASATIQARMDGLAARSGAPPAENANAAATVHLRLDDDRVQVSVDACGELLHRRGYRREVGQAPLRETLAAAVLQRAGYTKDRILWDPCCGSGTLPIEACGIAAHTPPGAARGFAFQRWPVHDEGAYAAYLAELTCGHPIEDPTCGRPSAEPASAPPRVIASDCDAEVLARARRNAARAGVEGAIDWHVGDFADVATLIPPGAMIVSNLPYGHRMAAGRAFALRFAALLQSRRDLSPVHVLTADPAFARQSGLPFAVVAEFSNRGLRTQLLVAT